MEKLNQLIKERKQLTKALKNGDLTTNEYQTFFYTYSQKIKKLRNNIKK